MKILELLEKEGNKGMISANEFYEFLKRYHDNPGPLRLGQAFCGEHPNVTDPELFYCENKGKAIRLIADKYLDTKEK